MKNRMRVWQNILIPFLNPSLTARALAKCPIGLTSQFTN